MSEQLRLPNATAALTTCTDMTKFHRRQTGRTGGQAPASYLTTADATGSTQRFTAAAIIPDFVIWPPRLLVPARRSVTDRHTHKASQSPWHRPRCKMPDGSCDEGRNCNNYAPQRRRSHMRCADNKQPRAYLCRLPCACGS